MRKKSIVPFSFDGADVRVVDVNGEPWFVASDVARVLGYENISRDIQRHCKAVRKISASDTATETVLSSSGHGGARSLLIIPERDVYRLIMRSKLPAAEKFEEWVVGEVLPSIRKTGSYTMTRAKSKEYRKMFTDTLKLAGYNQPRQYQHTTTEMKLSMGLGWKPKAEMTEDELTLTMASEALSTLRIKNEEIRDAEKAHHACVDTSTKTRGLIYSSEHDRIAM